MFGRSAQKTHLCVERATREGEQMRLSSSGLGGGTITAYGSKKKGRLHAEWGEKRGKNIKYSYFLLKGVHISKGGRDVV